MIFIWVACIALLAIIPMVVPQQRDLQKTDIRMFSGTWQYAGDVISTPKTISLGGTEQFVIVNAIKLKVVDSVLIDGGVALLLQDDPPDADRTGNATLSHLIVLLKIDDDTIEWRESAGTERFRRIQANPAQQ